MVMPLLFGAAAYLVQSNHPIEAIECGILYAFGHYRRGELLKAEQEFCFESSAGLQ